MAARYRANRAGLIGLLTLTLITLAALAAPLIAPASGLDVTTATAPPLAPPSLTQPLGADATGRSVLTLTLWGGRTSLLVGLLAATLSTATGTAIGVAAGHFGGLADTTLMRLTDWFLVLPALPLAIAAAAALGRGPATITLVIGLTTWPSVARLTRAHTLADLERARVLGATHWRQLRRHLLPDVLPLTLAASTLKVADAILLEATLSFLGLGDPDGVSWGTMLQQAFSAGAVTAGAWWYLLSPGLAILTVTLAFTLCGRAVEAAAHGELTGRQP